MHILNGLWELIKTYWLDIIIVAGGITGLTFWVKKAIKNKNYDQLIDLAKTAVSYAERLYKSETGQLKKAEAIAYVQQHSWIARTFLTSSDVDVIVEKAVSWLNDELTAAEQKALLE